MTIRIGLIGAGIMGSDHARILATQVPGARLHFICDADAARCTSIATETGARHTSTDPLAVINSAEVDAIVIASPDDTHGSLTRAAIAARKHALCEKPLAPTAVECFGVVDAEVRGELVGERGSVSLRSPVHSETSLNLMQGVSYPEDWRPRFAEAYRRQNQAWLKSIETGKPAGASAWDGYAATLVAEAGVASLASGGAAPVVHAPKPALY